MTAVAAAAATDRPVPTRCSAFMFEAKIETDSVLEPEHKVVSRSCPYYNYSLFAAVAVPMVNGC